MAVFCITQARMGSSRLPNKVLLPVGNTCLLDMHMHRVSQSALIDQHIIAIADTPNENKLIHHCIEHGYKYHIGSEHNVLNRFINTADKFGATNTDLLIRLTSDCPLVCPELIDFVIEKHYASLGCDYSHADLNFYPRGFDIEAFNFEILKQINQTALSPAQKEHVTLSIYQHGSPYKINHVQQGDEEWAQWRLCVDEEQDLHLIRQLYSKLENCLDANHIKICEFLKIHPKIARINLNIHQKTAH